MASLQSRNEYFTVPVESRYYLVLVIRNPLFFSSGVQSDGI